MGDRSLAFGVGFFGERPPCVKGAPPQAVGDCGFTRESRFTGKATIPPSALTRCHLPLHKGGFSFHVGADSISARTKHFWRIASILLYQIPRPCATGFERLRGSLLAAAQSPGGRCFDSFQGIVKHTLKLPKHPPAMRTYLKRFSLPDRVRNEK